MRRRSLLRLGLAAVAAALAASSCLSPTLPLPPPDVASISPAAEPGLWLVSGTCAPGALVTVLNEETGEGVVFEDRAEVGKWFVELEAEECDRAWVSQEHGNDASARNLFIVEALSPDEPSGGACQ